MVLITNSASFISFDETTSLFSERSFFFPIYIFSFDSINSQVSSQMPEDRSTSPASRAASREQLPPINAGQDTTQLISDLKILANRVFALSNPTTPAWDEPDRKVGLPTMHQAWRI